MTLITGLNYACVVLTRSNVNDCVCPNEWNVDQRGWSCD